MFITKKKHDAMVKGLHQEIRALDQLAGRFKQQRDEARAELAAAHQRRIAPLMQANARRKREAAERKGEGN
ncbi:hypothetical protein [Sphingobium baderi]|uniref:Uncharacterized protein n=1 Tax=Sphingobium baderi LL03 TaxID=1114964 RepID=T0HBV3_9SPHN|nr:hypothetical protein [Sphingobium baderi]EQA96819.1 hypothetical protein L485_22310 [Sphingobium baderi LL03]EQB06199.1 hypothetical protein L485_00795 [Sphingobium baderi LL03]KMS62777.1 hypothetical protein V475_06275 [Sphingobium baderi LL03]KMS64024.1 hypothetical protein V475_23220 [Sphingobium baderi LL03]